jgi:hypothetical protein
MKMDRFAALHYANACRNHAITDSGFEKNAAVRAKAVTVGAPETAVTTLSIVKAKQIVRQPMQYLGMVKPDKNIANPPELKTLRTTASMLSLPTSRQLRCIVNNGADSAEQCPALEAICNLLDGCNKNLRKSNKLSSGVERYSARLRVLDAECEERHVQMADVEFNHRHKTRTLELLLLARKKIESRSRNYKQGPERCRVLKAFMDGSIKSLNCRRRTISRSP